MMKRAPNAENVANENGTSVGTEPISPTPLKEITFNAHLPAIKPELRAVTIPVDCLARTRKHMNCRLSDASIWFNNRLEEYQRACIKPPNTIGNPTVMSADPVCAVGRIVCDANDARLTCRTAVLECAKGVGGGHRVQLDFTKYTDNVSLFPGQLMAVQGVNQSGKLVVSHIYRQPVPAPDYNVDRPIKMAISAIPLSPADDPENFDALEKILEKTFDANCDVLVLFGPIVNAHVMTRKMTRLPVDHYNHVMSRLSLLTTNSHCTVILCLGPNDLFMDPVYPPCPATALATPPTRVHVVDHSDIVSVSNLRMLLCPIDVLMHISGEEVSQNTKTERLTRLFEHLLEQRSPHPLYPPHASVPTDYQSVPRAVGVPDIVIAPSVLRAGVHVAGNGSVLVNPGRASVVIVEVNPGGTPATSISVRC